MTAQKIIAGVDEVGRGALAGPVVIGIVILDPQNTIIGLDDSKKLSKKTIATLSDEIKKKSLCFAIGYAEAEEIDNIGIWKAIELSINRGLDCMKIKPTIVNMDGIVKPNINYECKCYKGGDSLLKEISAASIIAKNFRDNIMQNLHKDFPVYGWYTNVGYPTKQHKDAIKKFGYTNLHRKSYSPVKNYV